MEHKQLSEAKEVVVHGEKDNLEFNNLPYILKADHVAQILGIHQSTAYEIMNRSDFPLIQLDTSSKRVKRDSFFEWLESKERKKTV